MSSQAYSFGQSHACYPNTPPQADESPSSVAKCLTLANGKASISVSTIMSLVGQ